MKYLKYQDINCLLWYSLKSLSTGHYTQLHLCSYLATVQLETIQKCFKRCRRSVSGLVHVDAHAVFRVFRWKAAVSESGGLGSGDRDASWGGKSLTDVAVGVALKQKFVEKQTATEHWVTLTLAHLCATASTTGTDPVVSVEILFLSYDTKPPPRRLNPLN